MNSPSPPTPTPAQVAEALGRTKQVARVREASPSWDDLRREIGVRVVQHPDGTKSARIEGKDQLRCWSAMNREARRAETDLWAERHAQTPTEDVYDPCTGRMERLPAQGAAKAARGRGLHAVPNRRT